MALSTGYQPPGGEESTLRGSCDFLAAAGERQLGVGRPASNLLVQLLTTLAAGT